MFNEGFSYKEIAEKLNITEKAVNHALIRARKNLEVEGIEEQLPEVEKSNDTYIIKARGGGRTISISETKLRLLKELYCGDSKLTINQICRKLDLPRRDFILIKSAFGITKDQAPYLPEDLLTRETEDLVKESLEKREYAYFVKFDQKAIEKDRRELIKYKEQDYQLEKLHNLIATHMKTFAREYRGPAIIKTPQRKKEFVIEPAICDLHLGKLGYEPEAGENYDYKIAKSRFDYIIDDVYLRAKSLPIKKVLYPFGNDFWQINSKKGTTFAGTIVDADSRVQKLFAVGIQMHITAIDKLRQLAPVTVVLVPGNHDEEISFYALMYLAAWYKDAKDVEVWTDIKSRKYVWFGINLIGFAHGHQEGKRILGNMQVEAPEAWGKTKVREFHVAHKHRYQVQEENGVVVRELSALTGKDAWEFGKGYQGAITKTQTFVWHKEDGLYAIWEKAIWPEKESDPVLTI